MGGLAGLALLALPSGPGLGTDTLPPMFNWSSVCGARPAVMGIVNVTPDSFSDGGRYLDPAAAIRHGIDLVAAGADMLDIGGESTRPGAEPVAAAEELRRVVPVIEALAAQVGVPVSIDTTKPSVAHAALEAGAVVVNDVSAGRNDLSILDVTAAAGAGYVVMHMLGEPRTMQRDPHYDDVVAEVGAFLTERLAAARAAGIAVGALAADPGIGFGKTTTHNLELLARLTEIVRAVDVPVVVGASRKRFLGELLRGVAGHTDELAPDRRDDATLATVVWALEHGARIVRVHDARAAAHAVAMLDAIRSAA